MPIFERAKSALAAFGLAAALGLAAAPAAKAADIVDIAAGDERFSTLVAAVQAAGLVDALKGPGPLTVFAPTNDAFAALPEGTVETLLEPENKGQLTDILLYHVDDRLLRSIDLPGGTIPVKPLNAASRLCITKDHSSVTIGDSTDAVATVIIADIEADNGVIHVVDKVLLPGRLRCGH
ncbi:MAG: fasciclin domain-containing protein [Pseudomonadota bacterium]